MCKGVSLLIWYDLGVTWETLLPPNISLSACYSDPDVAIRSYLSLKCLSVFKHSLWSIKPGKGWVETYLRERWMPGSGRGRQGQLWFPSAFMAGDEVHRQVDGHWQGAWEAGRIQFLDWDQSLQNSAFHLFSLLWLSEAATPAARVSDNVVC